MERKTPPPGPSGKFSLALDFPAKDSPTHHDGIPEQRRVHKKMKKLFARMQRAVIIAPPTA
jgi:hypothetical protein